MLPKTPDRRLVEESGLGVCWSRGVDIDVLGVEGACDGCREEESRTFEVDVVEVVGRECVGVPGAEA